MNNINLTQSVVIQSSSTVTLEHHVFKVNYRYYI